MEKTKKIETLKENHMFSKLYSKGKCYPSGSVAVYVLKNYNRSARVKLGITVSKNRGNSVVRNHIKRKIKEAYRSLHPFLKDGFIIVIVARNSAKTAHVSAITEELYRVFKNAFLLKEQK